MKVYRQSGSPVDPEMQEQYLAEYQAYFDKCEQRAKRVFEKNVPRLRHLPEMIIMQRMLQFGERLILKKYNKDTIVDMPKTRKAWAALLSRFHDTPVMVAKEAKSGTPILILMDELQ